MTFQDAKKIAQARGYEIMTTSGQYNWFSANMDWHATGQTINLQVWIDPNGRDQRWELGYITNSAIKVTTGQIGSFTNDVHFLKWQMNFMRVIEKLV